MWQLGTWLRSGFGSAGLRVGLNDVEGFSTLNEPMILWKVISLCPSTSLGCSRGSFPWHPSLHRLWPELWHPGSPAEPWCFWRWGRDILYQHWKLWKNQRAGWAQLHPSPEPPTALLPPLPQPSNQGRGCPQLSPNPELPPPPQTSSWLSSIAPPASFFPLAEQRECRKQTPDAVFLFQGQMYLNNLQSLA